MKQTKAEAEAYDLKRTHAMWAIDRAAIQLCAPDLANLPDYAEAKPGRPSGSPDWFRRIVWDCQGIVPRLYARARALVCVTGLEPAL
jgi:hypothetical protein